MANANARIDIDINTSEAAAGLKRLQAQLNAFNSTLTKGSTVQATAMRNAKDNLMELVNASRFFTAETVRMQTAAGKLDKTLAKGQGTLGQFFSAKFLRNSAAAASALSLAETRAAALQTQFVATGAAANGMRDAIAIRPLQAFNNAAAVSAQKLAIHRAMLNQATTSMINFGKNTQWTGRQLMVGFTVPLTIFGAVAGKTFRELEKEAVNFKKVYGDAFTPPEEMQANLDAVKELAKEYTKYGIAVKDTIGLAAEAAAAGAQNQELLDATTQATRLATLGQMEQNEALKTTISLQNAFKLSGDELAKSVNFLNMVENQTVVTLQDLSGAIPRVAPVIKGLGGDVEDLAAFLAAMQEGGVSAAQGAQALKSGLASLINPTDKAKEKLQDMGISLDTIIQANRGDLMGTVQALADAFDTLDQFSRQQAIEEIFGKFQYARLAALFDNINKEGTQAARVLEMTGMSAAEMAASAEKELGAIEEAVGTKFTAAMEKLQLAIAPIGEMFTKLAIPVINFLSKIADAFNNLPDFAKKFIGLATVVVGLVIPAGTMFLGLLVNLVGTLIKFGAVTGSAFRGFLSGGIKGAFDAVSQSVNYMSLEQIDAATASQQLAGSTEAVNAALLGQVGASEGAQAAVMELAYAYEILTQQMRETAAMNEVVFGTSAAAMGAAGTRGPRVRRNRGGTIPGSGNTDTVPAMLTPGEFVVNKQATQDNLPLLRQINESGKVPGYFAGGIVARLLSMFRGKPPINNQTTTPIVPKGNPRQQAEVRRQQGRQNQEQRFLENDFNLSDISEPAKRRAWSLANRLNIMTNADTRGSVGFHSKYNQQLKDGNVNANPTAKQLLDDLNDDAYDSFVVLKKQAQTWNSKNPNSTVNADTIVENFKRSLSGLKETKINDTRIKLLYREAIEESGINGRDFLNAIRRPAVIDAKMRIRDQESGLGRAGYSARNVQQEFGSGLDNSENLIKADLLPDGRIRISRHIRKLDEEQKKAGIGTEREEMAIISVGEKQYIKDGRSQANIWVDDGDGPINLRLLRGELGSAPGADYSYKSVTGPGIEGVQFAHANKGGHIVPGTGNKDTVPAMLTPGEFVVNKKATQSNMALLKAINDGNIRGYAAGDVVGDKRNGFYAEGTNGMKSGPFPTRRMARKEARQIVRNLGISRSGGIGMRGMGLGMGMGMAGGAMFMGAGMMPNQGAAAAMQVGGTALSMASMLPMLGVGGPVTLAIAGIAAAAVGAGVAIKAWRESVDSAARSAAEFGANLGGTANALNTIATITGQQTPLQRRRQVELGITNAEMENIMSPEMSAMLTSEKGQALIEELKSVTSAERFQKLADYLKSAIASGLMDREMATSFAKAVSFEVKDSLLGRKTATAISSQEVGSEAFLELSRKRTSAADSLFKKFENEFEQAAKNVKTGIDASLNEIQDSVKISGPTPSQVVGLAMQGIQDYANVQALAQEEFANGTISLKQFTEITKEASEQQQRFTVALKSAVEFAADPGAAMQGVIDQLKQSGFTEEDFKSLEEAAKVSATGADFNVSDAIEASQELKSVGVAALQVGTDLVTVNAALRDLADTAVEGTNAMRIAFNQFGNLPDAIAKVSISGLLGGQVPVETAQTQAALDDFIKGGGDTGKLQGMLASMSQQEATQTFNTLTGLGDPAQQNQFMSDFEAITQAIDSEYATQMVNSKEYLEELGRGQTTTVDSIKEAGDVFGESTKEMVAYAKKVKVPLTELNEKGKAIADLPDELAFKLGVEATNIEDLKKFGPIADELGKAWPILQKLPESFNLKAFVEANTSKNGELASPEKLANEMILIKDSLADLDSTKPQVVKKAVVDILVAHGGKEADAQSAFSDILGNMEDFNDFQLEDKMAIVGIMVKYMEDVEALSEVTKEAMNLTHGGAMYGQQYYEERVNESAAQAEIATQAARVNMAGGNNRGGGGGGTPEKTLFQQLKEQAQASQKMLAGMSGLGDQRGFKKFISGPFAPEFLEYLRSQGEKGLKLIKGGLDKVKKAYANFVRDRSAQLASQALIAPKLRKQEMNDMQTEIDLRNQLAKAGRSQEEIDFIVERTSEYKKQIAANKDLIEQEKAKPKGERNQKFIDDLREGNSVLREDIKLVKQSSEGYVDLARSLEYAQMSVKDLQQALRDNQMQQNDLQRQIAEYEVIRPLEDQLEAQQKILEAGQREIELKQRTVDEIGRQIELEQRRLEPIDDAIEKLEEQKTKVEESYDTQLKALDDIARKEDNLARIREGRLDVASALSRGDVGAAAQAAIEMQRRFAEGQQEAARTALEARRQQEIDAIQGNIKQKQEERKVIEQEIERLQLSQRDIQDEIYQKQQDLIPVQDEIYRLNNVIANEADRLDDLYSNAALQVQNLKDQLRLAKDEALALVAALNNKVALEQAANAANAAANAPIVTGEAPSTPFTGWNNEFADNPVMIYSPEQISANIDAMGRAYGGKIKKYAMGGMVNYKGSREPAPGMMYGGKMKKYAMGSFVPGRGMTDKVPAMLTPGEFVVRKSVASQYGPLLQAMNSDIFPGMRGIANDPVFYAPSVNASSLIAPISNLTAPMDNRSMQYNYSVNVNAKTDADANEIANVVINKIKRIDDRQVKGVRL